MEWDAQSDEDTSATRPLLPQDDRIWRHPSEVAAASQSKQSASATPVFPTTSSVSVNVTNRRGTWASISAAALFGACVAVGFLAATGWVQLHSPKVQSATQVLSSTKSSIAEFAGSWLGIETGEATPRDAATMATLVMVKKSGSAVIYTVMPHSPAESAGLKPGDVIVAVGGSAVTSAEDLAAVLHNFQAGQSTTISVYRIGKQVDINVQFAEKPQDT